MRGRTLYKACPCNVFYLLLLLKDETHPFRLPLFCCDALLLQSNNFSNKRNRIFYNF